MIYRSSKSVYQSNKISQYISDFSEIYQGYALLSEINLEKVVMYAVVVLADALTANGTSDQAVNKSSN